MCINKLSTIYIRYHLTNAEQHENTMSVVKLTAVSLKFFKISGVPFSII